VSSEAASTSPPVTSAAAEEDQVIRERVRVLMSQILRQGQVDPESVKEVMRAVTGGAPSARTPTADASGVEFAAAVRRLDAALVISAEAAHRALEAVAIRGNDVTDNDIKGALVNLMKLREDCLATANQLSQRASGENLRRELDQLAVHAQKVGVEVSLSTICRALQAVELTLKKRPGSPPKPTRSVGGRSRPHEFTFWPSRVSSRTPSAASTDASRTRSSGWRLCSRPRTLGTMQYEQTELQPIEICSHAWCGRSRRIGRSPANSSNVEKWPRGSAPPAPT